MKEAVYPYSYARDLIKFSRSQIVNMFALLFGALVTDSRS